MVGDGLARELGVARDEGHVAAATLELLEELEETVLRTWSGSGLGLGLGSGLMLGLESVGRTWSGSGSGSGLGLG